MIWSILSAIFIGFFTGLLARAVHPGDDKAGFWLTVALGITGSLLATFLGKVFGLYQPGQSAGFIMSILGGVLVLLVFNVFKRKRKSLS